MAIKEEINNYLNNQLDYLEIYLINGMSYIVYKPNQDDAEAGQITLEESGIRIVISFVDSCKQSTYIPYDNIVYINTIFECPQLENDIESE